MDKQLLENYLEYLNELNKWEKKVQSGEMSKQDLARIRKAKIARDADSFRKGIDKGSDNIIKRAQSTLKYSKKANKEGPKTIDSRLKSLFNKPGSTIHMPSDKYGGIFGSQDKINKPEKWDRLAPYVKRHEADEARYSTKQMKKHKVGGAISFTRDVKNAETGKTIYSREVGLHASPGVLKKEKELTDFTSRMYGDAKKLRQYRNKTGEYEFVKNMTNKYINKFDNAVAKTRNQQLSAIDREIASIKAQKIRGFLPKLKAYSLTIKHYIKSNPSTVKRVIKTIKI